MGNKSEMNGLVVAITFLASVVLLINLIPAQFNVAEYEGRTTEAEEYFEIGDVTAFNETWTYRMNETGGVGEFGWYQIPIENAGEWFGGHDLTLWYTVANASTLQLYIVHHYAEWIIWVTSHRMEWINYQGQDRGTYLYGSELDEDVSSLDYTVKCGHFFMQAYFAYNETLYSSPSEAWDYHGLWIRLGIHFDQMAMTFNAFNLIGALLFFQLPAIHWAVNALIAIPLWVCIIYLSFIFILRVVGAVFGGGGA